jgi:hypothetical protein
MEIRGDREGAGVLMQIAAEAFVTVCAVAAWVWAWGAGRRAD